MLKEHLKTSIIILLTIILTGPLMGGAIRPYQTNAATVDGVNIEEEVDNEEVDNEEEKLISDDLEGEEVQDDEEPAEIDKARVAYLTFDDGPSPKITPQILDILKEYNIKATFFVIGSLAEKYPDILFRIQEEGHLIANHTFTHNYKYIYSNPQMLINELKRTDELFRKILGKKYKESRLIRFPGGSFGEERLPFRQAVEAAGYINMDWNVVNGDAEGVNVTPQKQLQRLQETLGNKNSAIVLMHDSNTKQTTVHALPHVIEYIKSKEYVFEILDESEF